jgi:hypothetical protein
MSNIIPIFLAIGENYIIRNQVIETKNSMVNFMEVIAAMMRIGTKKFILIQTHLVFGLIS